MTSPTATSDLGAGAPFDGPAEGTADEPVEGVADEPVEGRADGLLDGLPDGDGFGRVPGELVVLGVPGELDVFGVFDVFGLFGECRTVDGAMTARPLFRSKDAILSADFSAGRPVAPPGRATALGVLPSAPSPAARTASCGEAVEPAAAGSAPAPDAAPDAPDPGPAHPATSSEAVATASKGAIPERAILGDLRTVGS